MAKWKQLTHSDYYTDRLNLQLLCALRSFTSSGSSFLSGYNFIALFTVTALISPCQPTAGRLKEEAHVVSERLAISGLQSRRNCTYHMGVNRGKICKNKWGEVHVRCPSGLHQVTTTSWDQNHTGFSHHPTLALPFHFLSISIFDCRRKRQKPKKNTFFLWLCEGQKTVMKMKWKKRFSAAKSILGAGRQTMEMSALWFFL